MTIEAPDRRNSEAMHISVRRDQARELRRIAQEEDRPVSWVIRRALERYLGLAPKQPGLTSSTRGETESTASQ